MNIVFKVSKAEWLSSKNNLVICIDLKYCWIYAKYTKYIDLCGDDKHYNIKLFYKNSRGKSYIEHAQNVMGIGKSYFFTLIRFDIKKFKIYKFFQLHIEGFNPYSR